MKKNILQIRGKKLQYSIALMLLFFIGSASAIAQKQKVDKDNYKERADSLRKAVWNWNKPAFSVRTIPAEYADASRIIIARRVEIIASGTLMLAGYQTTTCDIMEVTREVVKINDKAAIADYSEFAFTRLLKTPGRFINNTMKTYIGVRVIKPGGSIKEVSADEILLTKDEVSIKEAKLAIPDLQVGDIIDYFLAKEQNLKATGSAELENYTFAFFDDAPVMHYSVLLQTAKPFTVEYRSYNDTSAPARSVTENSDNILEFVKTNIPVQTEGDLWINPYKQLPILRMSLQIVVGYYSRGARGKDHVGKINDDPDPNSYIESERYAVENFRSKPRALVIDNIEGKIKDYYKWLKKNGQDLPFDSLVAELYYVFRYAHFLNVDPNDDITQLLTSFHKKINSNRVISNFGAFIETKGIDWDIVLVTSRYGPGMNQVMSSNDIDWLLLAKGQKYKLFGMDDVFSPAFHIPSEYEDIKSAPTVNRSETSNPGIIYKLQKVNGQKMYHATPTGETTDFYRGRADVPVSNVSDNSRLEKLGVTVSSNGSQLEVHRQTTLKGHSKTGVQQKLILFEDLCNQERKLLGEDKTIIEELEENRKARKSYASELKAAFDKERIGQKDEFIKEAKEWFDQPITGLTDHKVENLGVRHNNPDFIYSSTFGMEGLVKKAGNNILIDIGKLQGSTLKATPNLPKRRLDIYMPFARSVQSQIILQVPEGYAAEGINDLNRKIENSSGCFIVEASSDGKAVSLTIKKSFNHSFESIGNWDKLVEIIEAASEWTNTKLLLKKK